jgi:hypothetical protein
MAPVKCFLVTPLEKCAIYSRRYTSPNTPGLTKWDCSTGHHDAQVYVKTVEDPIDEERDRYRYSGDWRRYKDDPRWPTKCDKCDYSFSDSDERQEFTDPLYHDLQGKVYTLRGRQPEFCPPGILPATPGMMWDAWWYSRKGPDGLSLVVICPGGSEWMIDSRASNCTMKDDEVHRCWVRHGTPPELTVDKNGNTCAAGAGSIQTSNWHGFLRGGCLVE